MPDEAGEFRGISIPAEAWERIFGVKPKEECTFDCDRNGGPHYCMCPDRRRPNVHN